MCVRVSVSWYFSDDILAFRYYFAIVSHRLTFYEQIKVSAKQKRQSEKEMAKHRKQFAPLSQNIFGIICVCVWMFWCVVYFTSFLEEVSSLGHGHLRKLSFILGSMTISTQWASPIFFSLPHFRVCVCVWPISSFSFCCCWCDASFRYSDCYVMCVHILLVPQINESI